MLSESDFAVFATLGELRRELAQADGVAPYLVFNNRQLAEMVQKKIRTSGAGDLAGGIYAECGCEVLAFPFGRVTKASGERPEATNRVIRGGSWNDESVNCRAAYRNRNEPQNLNDNLGFRVAAAPCARGGCPAGWNRPLSSPAWAGKISTRGRPVLVAIANARGGLFYEGPFRQNGPGVASSLH